jgi:methylthioribulose-1-phosphate dehydratase
MQDIQTGPIELAARRALVDVAHLFYERGWAYGTSGNYSVVLSRDPLRLLITSSGRDKRALTPDDLLVVDETGRPIEPTPGAAPSAETLLHTLLATVRPEVGAVLHTHSVWNTILSRGLAGRGELSIAGYEMLKGLSGITTHEATARIAVVDNTQDIAALAGQLRPRLAASDPALQHAFLMSGHGLYTWGRDLSEARRHVEILEFLFEVVGRRQPI